MSRGPSLFSVGTPVGVVAMRKVVMMDASCSGWGTIHEGRVVNGIWSLDLRYAHINYLELRTVFLALRHFSPFLQSCHILVRTDNTTMVAYINCQGGTRSLQLHRLAHRLLMWFIMHEPHVGRAEQGSGPAADLGNPLYGEWRLHPQVVEQIWQKYGQAAVDLQYLHRQQTCSALCSSRW